MEVSMLSRAWILPWVLCAEASQIAMDQATATNDDIFCIYGGLTGVDFPEEYPRLQMESAA
jgi:hypothetical protein